MTDPVFYAGAEAFAGLGPGDRFVLDGDEGRHAAIVRRLRAGERLVIGDGAGTLAECVATAVHRAALEVEIVRRREVPSPRPRVVVVQALVKGERGERAVETLTEVGVDEIVPWQAARCVTRWDAERAPKGVGRWRAAAREAGKQSRRAWIPAVTGVADTAGVVARAAAVDLAVVLHESADDPLAGAAVPSSGEIVLVVGPEGGLAPEEIEALRGAGAVTRRLGPTVLRASTAGTVGAALTLAACGRLG